jgi:hypothetical protein
MKKSKKYSNHLNFDLHIHDFETYFNYFKAKKIDENEYLVTFLILRKLLVNYLTEPNFINFYRIYFKILTISKKLLFK